jgi:hypothetical protein
MKLKTVFSLVSAVCVIFLTTSFLSAESESQGAPSAYFPADQYEFDQVLEGSEVIHDLVVQNKGTAPLEVKGVGTD